MYKNKTIWIFNHYASSFYNEKGGRHFSIAKYLKKYGYTPVIFCSNKIHNTLGFCFENYNLTNERIEEDTGVKYVFVRGRNYKKNGLKRLLNIFDYYFNLFKIIKQYEEGPDLIYASSVHPLTLVAGIKIAKRLNIKCVCEVRDLWPESLIAYDVLDKNSLFVFILRGLEKWIYIHADSLIFTMEGAYRYIIEQGWEYDIPSEKVHYINNGVDIEQFDKNKTLFGFYDKDLNDPNTFKVIYTGSIRKANRLEDLVNAAAKIKEENIRILIWGNGDELEALKTICFRKSINNIVFKGAVEKKKIPYIISNADILFLDPFDKDVAKYGISSNKLFEYFASGKPILTNVDSEYNPAQKKGCNLLYTSDADGISNAIISAYKLSKAEYTKLCEHSADAAKDYSFENLTMELIKVFENT